MDISHARKNAERFHKTTLLLASRVTGLPYAIFLSGRFVTLPVIVGDGQRLAMFYQGGKGEGDSDSITPYVVNGAFSLELNLKVLRYLETGAWPKGHDFKKLYRQLTQTSRDFLTSTIQEVVIRSEVHRQIEAAINQKMNIPFSWDVDSLIEHSSNAFVNWRYAFESRPGWFAGYNEIRNAVVGRIRQIEKLDC